MYNFVIQNSTFLIIWALIVLIIDYYFDKFTILTGAILLPTILFLKSFSLSLYDIFLFIVLGALGGWLIPKILKLMANLLIFFVERLISDSTVDGNPEFGDIYTIIKPVKPEDIEETKKDE